jgi:hypothetical protein
VSQRDSGALAPPDRNAARRRSVGDRGQREGFAGELWLAGVEIFDRVNREYLSSMMAVGDG